MPSPRRRGTAHIGNRPESQQEYGQAPQASRPAQVTGLAREPMMPANVMSLESLSGTQIGAHTPGDHDGLFHNYLRAFCTFDSLDTATMDESLLMTASIKPGDLILVHSVHDNGWADGTVLTTGERGWLPTNYCEPFSHPYLENLLYAMTQLWDLLGASEDATLSAFVRQDYIRGLIAGVRYLLEHADCLHRDAALVQRDPGIRRMRKGLLADLSSLVQISKRLQETISEPFAGKVIHFLLDDLMAKAFKIVTRAVGFVDVWTQEASSRAVNESSVDADARPGPMTPRMKHIALTADIDKSLSEQYRQPVDSAKFLPEEPDFDSRAHDSVAGAGTDATCARSIIHPLSGWPVLRKRSVAHRLSLMESKPAKLGILASERLAKLHDLCISHIGAFIGLHMQARPTSDLTDTSNLLVQICNDMLDVVDEACSRDRQRSVAVPQARMNFQTALEDVIELNKEVIMFSESDDDDDVFMLPEQSSNVIAVATRLIRTAGECVAKTRSLIEQIGDFGLDSAKQDSELEELSAVDTGDGIKNADPSTSQGHPPSDCQTVASPEQRSSKTTLPIASPTHPQSIITTDTFDFALQPADDACTSLSPATPVSATSHMSLPVPTMQRRSAVPISGLALRDAASVNTPNCIRASFVSTGRSGSFGVSITGSTDTQQSSARDSRVSHVSEVSTRATTPDLAKELAIPSPAMLNSFGSLSSIRSIITDLSSDAETRLLQRTYACELMLNKDGQVTGGSLPALVEQLTTHDSAPDAQFVSAFFMTFRMFTTPRELAQALTARFDYVGDSKQIETPVRLRIYNVFKGWLETYWNAEADKDALGDVRYFALHKLKPHLLSAGERLLDLTRKVTEGYSDGTITGPLVSGIGKTSTSIGSQYDSNGSIPETIISKSQLNALRNRGSNCSILDFDPLELARQFTLMTSKIFCEIRAEELLTLDWGNKSSQKANNIRDMCIINTDLAHVVGDSILAPEDAKKRAQLIKHWSKVGMHCLELNNYDTLMAITCSLNSSVVQRLRRTWDLVSKKTKARLEELNAVVDYSRNQASLRRRLESPTAPCLPFLGIYLTDLTFADAGNPKTRELPGRRTSETNENVSVINFDKYMRLAKIVSHLQKFQVPYRLQPVPELQAWMQTHMRRMRTGNMCSVVGQLHRRSLIVEPKPADQSNNHEKKAAKVVNAEERPNVSGGSNKEKLDQFLRMNAFGFRQGDRMEVGLSPPVFGDAGEEKKLSS